MYFNDQSNGFVFSSSLTLAFFEGIEVVEGIELKFIGEFNFIRPSIASCFCCVFVHLGCL